MKGVLNTIAGELTSLSCWSPSTLPKGYSPHPGAARKRIRSSAGASFEDHMVATTFHTQAYNSVM